jgi:Ca2+-transporting ATPase
VKLHDPKDLDSLRAMGGLAGLVSGLRTNLQSGLSPDEDKLEGHVTWQDAWQETRRKEDNTKELNDTKASEELELQKKARRVSVGGRKASIGSARFRLNTKAVPLKGFSDRTRIFSDNRIPARRPKSIFQLMWMALHDKILVRGVLHGAYSRFF